MHPVGPRGPGVYWVRRALVIVVAVVVVVGVGWMLTHRGAGPDVDPAASTGSTEVSNSMTGVLASTQTPAADSDSGPGGLTSAGPGADADAPASVDSAVSSTSGAPVTPPAETASGAPKTTAGTGTTGAGKKTAADNAGTDNSSTGNNKAGKSKAGSSETAETPASNTGTGETKTGETKTGEKEPRKTSTAKTTPTRTPTTTPTTTTPPKPSYDDHGRLICPDRAVGVTAKTRSKSYPVGAQPVLVLTVTNKGSKPCVRDVSGTLQSFTVYTSGGDRVWSTDDCFPGKGTAHYRFRPGESRPYPVTWAGTTSTPGCQTERVTVKPGGYTVVAELGALKSKPYPFTMTRG